jgi:hypothetical protein
MNAGAWRGGDKRAYARRPRGSLALDLDDFAASGIDLDFDLVAASVAALDLPDAWSSISLMVTTP